MAASSNGSPANVTETDVVVIGGGPAGATSSTLIADKGYKVTLFERDQFPRYHIGESLIPETFWVLERLGMLPKLRGSHFVKKYSVQFVNQRGKLSEPFYFVEHKPHESSQTWQILRSEFDQLMLDNAREHGVTVHEQTRVLDVLFENGKAVGVRTRSEDGVEREVRCKVVVDASGQGSMLMDRFGLREWDPVLKKAALWTYWKGAPRDVGENEGATMVLQTKDKAGWFWSIPQHNDVTSVGVVAGVDYLFKNRDTKASRSDTQAFWEEIYFQEVDRCPGVKERIGDGSRCDTFHVEKEYSYRSREASGDGWVLCGDAYGFLDPLYSSGVLLALKGGSLAADAVTEGLAKGDVGKAQLGRWSEDFNVGMDRMRRLVCAYYEGFSFGRFVARHPHLKGYLTDLLIGDLWDAKVDAVWEPLEEMRAEMGMAPTTAMG
ncbi:MAG: NAD(P)/FAD-dependent oxidoreductase [Planctomycetaceae bacterium]